MQLNAENLLIFFVGVTAFAMTIQALSVWQAARTVQKMADNFQQEARQIQESVETLSQKLSQVSESLEPMRILANEFSENAQFAIGTFRRISEEVDQLLKELVELGREQASKVDYLVTDTVEKFEQTTEVIQQDVLRPALEIGSFIKGVQSGLSYFFGRKGEGKSTKKPTEEELFI